MASQRWLRVLTGLVSLLALALLLLIAAWLASNWNDAPPQPRPAALQLPSPSLPDDRNAYFMLAGLRAAPDRDPSTAGQARWKLLLARATVSKVTPYSAVTEQSDAAAEAALGKSLPSLPGCNGAMGDCVAQWIDRAEALNTQRKEHALLGQRCERLLDGDLQFDEALAPMRTVLEPIAQHAAGASDCSHWFLGGAVLAWVQQDRTRVIDLLGKSDRLNRALLRGSHSLIGQMIAIRTTRNTLDTLAGLAVRDAAIAAALAPMLAPLPGQVDNIQRWMVVEAAFNRGAYAEISAACDGLPTSLLPDDPPAPERVSLFGWLCRHRIGWHPERIAQTIDAAWLHSIRQLAGGLPMVLRSRSSQALPSSQASVLDALTWQNTLGNTVLLTAPPDYDGYLARHADLELHQETVALTVQSVAKALPAADRRAWLAQQPLSATARDRLTVSDDGLVLRARTWQEPGNHDTSRDAIRIAWPSPR